ncbi:hypothetical protein AB5J62_27765 [Amycolatopsis sp. cg5]|uniref:hypothetical protein n=1 Tax=Amycolatopsis sp. cg5 TaxID=3238802 RepID=UPI003525BAC9
MPGRKPLEHVFTFSGAGDPGCPDLFLDHDADEARRVVLVDGRGARIQLSLAQLNALVDDVKDGALDRLFPAEVS